MSTYTPIASVTLSSAQSSVTFSGIPQTYTDLVLVAAVTGVSVATDPWIRINSDTGTNYSWTWLSGNGSAASSERGTNNSKLYYSAISTIQNNVQLIQFNFMNYSNTTTYKTVLWRESDAGTETGATVGLWRSTSAINTLEISLDASRTYSAGTTFNLYGVANASITNVAKATGGDIVVTNGTYWYHAFLSSGTFTPTQNLNVEIVSIGGGGGGGREGGGGGAGEIDLFGTTHSLTASTNYTVAIGAGGTGGQTSGSPFYRGSNGSNTTFNSTTVSSLGGGGGGGNGGSQGAGQTGGSGGGGSGQYVSSQSGGGASGSNTFAGGSGTYFSSTNRSSGGGGGATAAGANGASGQGGAGGAGYTLTNIDSNFTSANFSFFNGMTVVSSGGGGSFEGSGSAGAGGTGGGNGTTTGAGGAPSSYGSGGGGGGGGNGANGYQGLLVVRYAV